MVLPGTVLFPNSVMPLRIFEPRYRAMLEFGLENDRVFCIALMKPGIREAVTEDQFFHTACLGLISASVTQEDGTSNLMLQGLARVRFVGFRQLKPFRIARIEPLPTVASDPEDVARLAQNLRDQLSTIRVNGSPLPDSLLKILGKITGPDALADAVAYALIGDAFSRQGILEEQEVESRLHTIMRLLREQFPAG